MRNERQRGVPIPHYNGSNQMAQYQQIVLSKTSRCALSSRLYEVHASGGHSIFLSDFESAIRPLWADTVWWKQLSIPTIRYSSLLSLTHTRRCNCLSLSKLTSNLVKNSACTGLAGRRLLECPRNLCPSHRRNWHWYWQVSLLWAHTISTFNYFKPFVSPVPTS